MFRFGFRRFFVTRDSPLCARLALPRSWRRLGLAGRAIGLGEMLPYRAVFRWSCGCGAGRRRSCRWLISLRVALALAARRPRLAPDGGGSSWPATGVLVPLTRGSMGAMAPVRSHPSWRLDPCHSQGVRGRCALPGHRPRVAPSFDLCAYPDEVEASSGRWWKSPHTFLLIPFKTAWASHCPERIMRSSAQYDRPAGTYGKAP